MQPPPSPTGSPPSPDFSPEWVRSLPPSELAALAALLEPRLTKYVPHRPHPPQAAFLLLPNREALFGGAAGGGKSDALLMAALQYADVPGFAALLLRRTFADLSQPDALIPRSRVWLSGTDATYNERDHQWTFPSGAVLKFGYLDNDAAVYQYQGAAFQFIGFDELTQFSQFQYDYLHSRLRKLEAATVPLRIRGSANPGGIGHEWVKAKFIDPTARSAGAPAFVPSKLEDNPSLDQAEYERSLEAIADPVLRLQLRHGDWNTRPAGRLFKREWFRYLDVRPSGIEWVRYWDLAATEQDPKKKNDPDWTAGALVGSRSLPGGAREVIIADVRRIRGTPGAVEQFVRGTAEEDGKGVRVFLEEEPGSSGKNTTHTYVSRVLYGWPVEGHRKTGSKVEMWGPLSSQAQGGNVHLVRGDWNGWWVEEAVAAPQPGVHDDGLDAVAGGMAKTSAPEIIFR